VLSGSCNEDSLAPDIPGVRQERTEGVTEMLNPSNYRPNRCEGSSNYPRNDANRTEGTGTCSTCEKPQMLTKTGLVKAHDK
jgi:hypothetical protein